MRKYIMDKRQYKKKYCVQCGAEHYNRGVACSRDCANKIREVNNLKIDLTCRLCGKIFHNRGGKGIYCPDDHYKKCEVCGKDFVITKGKESKENPTCGAACGAKYSHRNPVSKTKRKENSLKKWGVEYPFQAVEVKEKIEKSLEGTAGRFGTDASKAAIKKIYGVDNVSKLESVKEKKAQTLKENYTDKGIFLNNGPVSKINRKWNVKLTEATNLNWEYEKYFKGVGRIDLYAESMGKPIAVEINPTATHNSYYNVIACGRNGCDKSKQCKIHTKGMNDHFMRAKMLKELYGISLISVFDWMDEEKILSFVRSKAQLDSHKIFAKKTKMLKITQTEANRFLKEYHMLGASRKQTYCYGLYHDGELVQVQTFAPLKEEGSFEAKRLVTKKDWAVIGGVSKITKHFINEAEPKSITAFSDLNLSWPDYDVLHNGFERISINKPQKCWSKGNRMILQKNAAFSSADRLIGIANNSRESIYPENWTNDQVFLAEGWLPVWDCGMIKDQLIL